MSHGTILITRSLGLGDFCTAVPALRGLRRAFPHDHIVLAAPAWQWPFARHAGVDELVPLEGLAPLPTTFEGVDLAVNLHGSGPESIHRLLGLRPRRMLTFRHPDVAASATGPPWSSSEHDVDRWCRLVASLGVAVDREDARIAVDGRRVDEAARPVVVHPGADAPARRWPPERFACVVRHLTRRGHTVFLTGTAAERSLCHSIATASGGDHERVQVTAGDTDLDALAAILASARAALTNDTGVAHLAAAVATPRVVLFGPTDPAQWRPLAIGPQRVIWKGRVGDPHGDVLDPGLDQIGSHEVLSALDAVLDAPAESAAERLGMRSPS